MELEYKIMNTKLIIDQFQKKKQMLQTLQITALLQNEYLPIAPLCLQYASLTGGFQVWTKQTKLKHDFCSIRSNLSM